MKYKFVYVFIFLLFVVLAAYFAFANITRNTLTLANCTNTSLTNINFTFNATTNGSFVNASLYGNWNGSWVRNQTNQTLLVNNTVAGINTSSIIPEGTWLWNIEVCDNQNDSNKCSFATANYTITVDRTKPAVVITTPTAGQNKSGNITINTSIQDPTSHVQNVYYWLEQAGVNKTAWTAMTLTGGTDANGNWSATFTSTSVSDGTYNITINATDYAGNQNATEKVEIVIDTTAPTASLDCSPVSVSIGVSVTCTCTASDATSGVASYSYVLSTSTSSTASQTTSSAGTFTETCTVTDYAGNSVSSATFSYAVSSGGLPSGWVPPTTTYNIGTLTEAGVTKKVKVDEKVKFVSEEVQYTATIDEVTSTTAKLTLAGQTFSLSIGEEKKLDFDEDNIYEVSITLVGIAESKAELTFKAISEAVTPTEEEVGEELCGNDVVDAGENCENCPADVKCAADEECKDGVCVEKEVLKAKLTWLWITLGAVAVVIGILVYLATRKKK